MKDSPLPPAEPAGLYLHVPFCRRKCPYCDFYSVQDLSLRSAFGAAVEKEIEQKAGHAGLLFDTLYIGGGTPTLMPPAWIRSVVGKIRSRFSFSGEPEITLEANPGTVDQLTLCELREAGIHRLNLGIQSFSDSNLRALGRIHNVRQAENAIDAARKSGFAHIGLDLIYGLPGQKPEEWATDLQRALSFSPEHLSCYMLTVEKGTVLETQVADGRFSPFDEALLAELFRMTVSVLESEGYLQYEISNFSREGRFPSRHNRKYWTGAPYLGLGPSAHSYAFGERWWNHRNLGVYLDLLEAGRDPAAGRERLSPEQQMTEALFLGLRQKMGIDLTAFARRFGLDFLEHFADLTQELQESGLARTEAQRFVLTVEGMLLLDSVVQRFVDEL